MRYLSVLVGLGFAGAGVFGVWSFLTAGGGPVSVVLPALIAFSGVIILLSEFRAIRARWEYAVGPFVLGISLTLLLPRLGWTPGFGLAKWAEQSPFSGMHPPPFFIDVDPWLTAAGDALIFTTSGLLVVLVMSGALRVLRPAIHRGI